MLCVQVAAASAAGAAGARGEGAEVTVLLDVHPDSSGPLNVGPAGSSEGGAAPPVLSRQPSLGGGAAAAPQQPQPAMQVQLVLQLAGDLLQVRYM